MGILKHFPENVSRDTRKVYFSCHKDDFDLYFKEIFDDVSRGRGCALFYDADYDGERDAKFLFDLSEIKLFVMPITTRLLIEPNRAIDEEIDFAREHKISVLPIMMEKGLTELYRKRFGDLQFLDKTEQDKTALSYEEKLDKYLSSTLLTDETIKRIREEFDAQIFLSYRKKDRIHANRLMRLIHKNEFLRDVAIWYDEFLTPGENFNATIKEALSKSGLFVLAVTPSLLEPRIDEEGIEHKNYIEEHEYPMAKDREREGKIAILPAELVKTDSVLLSQKYENIPDCVDSDDENALTEALLATAKKLVDDENDNSPEHNYFIGLAYLNGIDVEVDHARAFEMIEYAANADYLEAIDKMIEMYKGGLGAERNYETAIQWHERKVALLRKRYDETPNEVTAKSLFWSIIYCGEAYKSIGNREEAKEKFRQAATFSESVKTSIEEKLTMQVASYQRIGDTYNAMENLKEAKKYYKKSLKIAEELVKVSDFLDSSLGLSGIYDRLANIYLLKEKARKAGRYCEKAIEIAEKLAEEMNTLKSHETLSVFYVRRADIYSLARQFEMAKEYYEKALKINEELVVKRDTLRLVRQISYCYGKLGGICVVQKNHAQAEYYFEKSLKIDAEIVEKTNSVEARDDIAVSYENLGGLYLVECNFQKALGYYEKILPIREALFEETGSDVELAKLVSIYFKLYVIYANCGEPEKAAFCESMAKKLRQQS